MRKEQLLGKVELLVEMMEFLKAQFLLAKGIADSKSEFYDMPDADDFESILGNDDLSEIGKNKRLSDFVFQMRSSVIKNIEATRECYEELGRGAMCNQAMDWGNQQLAKIRKELENES